MSVWRKALGKMRIPENEGRETGRDSHLSVLQCPFQYLCVVNQKDVRFIDVSAYG